MNYKRFVFVLVCLTCIFGFNIEVNAAATIRYSKANGSNCAYFEPGHNTCIGKKLCKDEKLTSDCQVAYCTGHDAQYPEKGVAMKMITSGSGFPGQNTEFAFVAAKAIELIKKAKSLTYTDINGKKFSGDDAKYIYITYALACLNHTYNGSDASVYSGLVKNVCKKNNKVNEFISKAREKVISGYDFSENKSTQKYNVTIPQNKVLTQIGTSDSYVSDGFTISYTVETPRERKPLDYTYNVTSPANTEAFLCTSQSFSTTNCAKSGSKTDHPLLPNQTYFIYLRGASSVPNGKITLKVHGENKSNYATVALWKPTKNAKKYQYEFMTAGDSTITRTADGSATFTFSRSNSYYASLAKIDNSGGVLYGSSMELFVSSKDLSSKETVAATDKLASLCTIPVSNSQNSCSVTDLTADRHHWTNDNFVCYQEIGAPNGYVKVPINCTKINTTTSDETVYYQLVDGNWVKFDDNHVGEIEYNRYTYNQKACITKNNSTSITLDDMSTIVNAYGNGSTGSNTSGDLSIAVGDYCSSGDNNDAPGTGNTSGDEDNPDNPDNPENNVETANISVCLYSSSSTVSVYNASAFSEENADWDKYCRGDIPISSFRSSAGSYNISVGNSLNNVSISKRAITDKGDGGDPEVPGATLAIYPFTNNKCSSTLATSKEFEFAPFTVPIEAPTEGEGDDSGDSSGDQSSSDNQTSTPDSGAESSGDQTSSSDEGEGTAVFPTKNATTGEYELKWVSGLGSAIISGLTPGRYCLIETIPPAGYTTVKTTTLFDMSADGTASLVKGSEGNAESVDENGKSVIVIRDKLNEMTISKTDMTSTKEVPGAKLAICEATDNKELVLNNVGECVAATLADDSVASWISTDKPHEVKGLPAGDYFLVERLAPDGYSTAEAIFFTMTDDGQLLDKNGKSLANNKLVMKDAKIPDVKTGVFGFFVVVTLFLLAGAGGYVSYKHLKEQDNQAV